MRTETYFRFLDSLEMMSDSRFIFYLQDFYQEVVAENDFAFRQYV